MEKISIIIPVFNERNTLQEVVRRCRAADLPCPREILIVDDGSTDGSDQIARGLEDSTVRAVIQGRNQGKGAAVRKGIEVASGDYILIQDADLEYDPDDWQKLVAPVLAGKATVVYGSRFTGERRNMMFWHWVGNRMLSFVTNVLYNTTLSDMETCYKLAPTEVLQSLGLKANKFDIEPEMTAKLLRKRVRIYEVPISYAGREFEEGKKITWRDGFSALWTLIKYRFGS
ncbi:MAG: glycosyl transferase [Acidobacteria bacterium]|nr:MAG: glycosyl transferase [Acidobacteriota bacterium]